MKKKLLLAVSAVVLSLTGIVETSAQKDLSLDRAPLLSAKNPDVINSKALWDIHFNYNTTSAAAGDVGMAGACYYNNFYWVSRWGSDTLYKFTTLGVLSQEFVIPGLTGTRSLTTDGTYLYAGTNTSTIYRIDPGTMSLSAPHITIAGSIMARFCSYDATLNSGAGGFWIGNFATDIEAISMTGTTLSTIPAATHGLTGMYGAAIDNFSVGGPFLWIFDQSGTNTTQLRQIVVATGATTAVTRDVYADYSASNSLTSGLAGGLFISDLIVPGEVTIGGIIQGTPNNVLFGYELTTVSGVGINENTVNNLNVFPNPSTGIFTVDNKNLSNASYSVMDVNGKVILNGVLQNEITNLDLTTFPHGVYVLDITSNGEKVSTNKLIKN